MSPRSYTLIMPVNKSKRVILSILSIFLMSLSITLFGMGNVKENVIFQIIGGFGFIIMIWPQFFAINILGTVFSDFLSGGSESKFGFIFSIVGFLLWIILLWFFTFLFGQ